MKIKAKYQRDHKEKNSSVKLILINKNGDILNDREIKVIDGNGKNISLKGKTSYLTFGGLTACFSFSEGNIIGKPFIDISYKKKWINL